MPVPEDLPDYGDIDADPTQRVVLKELEDGTMQEVVYSTGELPAPEAEVDAEAEAEIEAEIEAEAEANEQALEPSEEELAELEEELPSDAGIEHIEAIAKSEREFNALLRLQKDFERAAAQAREERAAEEDNEYEEQEEAEEEEEEEEEEEGDPDATFEAPTERVHQYSRMGQWRTNPTTLHLPKADFVNPISDLLHRTDTKHIQLAAENTYGGPGFPTSVATPQTMRNAPQIAIPVDSGDHKLSEIAADAYLATMMPGMYASVMSILVEVRKRLGSEWLQRLLERGNGEGPRVLDVGGGGAGLAAWEQVLQTQWDLGRESREKAGPEPPGKKTVVVGSNTLRHRISRFLHNTSFLPRLPDYLHSGDHPKKLEGGETSQPRKQYDIIIASHMMMPLKEGFRRKAMLDNLWEMLSPDGGVLIVMEKGHPRGFEAVADVRSRLINEFVVSPKSDPVPEDYLMERMREREPGMILAPCTNHKKCPMYRVPGLTPGRKDFCHFSQRFIRPPFLQKVLGQTHRNHEDIDFSFVAVQRGAQPTAEPATATTASTTATNTPAPPGQGEAITKAAFQGYENSPERPDPWSLPRNLMPPLKRHGHVTMDLCTPEGTMERWTVPRSFSKQAYRDARKARWGDLWALGAKTRVERKVRLGRGGAAPNDGGVRAQRATQGNKVTKVNMSADNAGIYSAKGAKTAQHPVERRTKGGKRAKPRDYLTDLTADED
ncbi:Rsm22-domain-containing protein [Xylariomycetidae sp. FL0641]|nr:Rsm22-domain-containing protein [Xylariomycetidae sp. FL0641]